LSPHKEEAAKGPWAFHGESRASLQAGARPMTDQCLIIEAIEESQRTLGEYIAPGQRNDALLEVLDRLDVVAALNRLKAGLHVVK
jgi:hypothetical protein